MVLSRQTKGYVLQLGNILLKKNVLSDEVHVDKEWAYTVYLVVDFTKSTYIRKSIFPFIIKYVEKLIRLGSTSLYLLELNHT